MEKLKNLINPGHKKDDEVLYGSGQSDDPVHTGHGHGHTAGKVEGNPLTSNKTGESYEGVSSTSRMPGGFDDSATTASVKSGVAGEPQSGSTMSGSNINDPLDTNKPLPREPETAGSGRATGASDVGPHSSSLANKADPRVDSDLYGSRGLGSGTTGAGSGVAGTTGTSGAGPHSSSLANKADPRVDSDSDGSRGLTSGTTGTSSGLTGTSLPDRSVGSTGYGKDSTTGSSHIGREAGLGAGAVGAGEAAHHHREKQEIGAGSGREFPLSGSSITSGSSYPSGNTGAGKESGTVSTTGGYGTGTGPTASSTNQGSLGSNKPLPSYNEEFWTHDHSKHGHQYVGDPCGSEAPAPGAPHFTKGPHALDTANRLDPHVGSDVAGSTNTESSITGAGIGSKSTGTGLGSSSAAGLGPGSSSTTGTGLGSSTTGTGLGSSSSGDRHLGRDAALAGGAGAVGVGAYESSRDGSGSTTAGPHKSGLMNKMDPRVDSDLSKQQGTSTAGTSGVGHGTSTVGPASGVTGSSTAGTALPSDNIVTGSTHGRDHHYGRDAGITGAGAAGLGAYEAGKHHGGQGLTGSTSAGSTSDPYSSSGVDPRIDSSSRSGTSGLTDTTGTSKDHHYGRDAGVAGAGGLGAYEGEKHLGGKHDASTIGSSGAADPTASTKDHHYGRDAGLAGAGGLAAYEGQKHLGGKHDPAQYGTTSTSTAQGTPGQVLYDSGRGPTTAGREQPVTGTGTSTTYGTPGQATGYDQQTTGSGHHLGRDAGLAGAGGVGAYESEKHLGKDHSRGTHGADPTTASTTQSTGHHYGRDAALGAGGVGAGTAAYEAEKHHGAQRPVGTSPGYENQQASATQSHTGRDAALAGGAGAGAGAAAGSEFSKKDAEHEAKQHQKELEKDQKHHQKELEKEHKHHQKEIAAAEKKHEKDAEKAEKQHEKQIAAAEKNHEKEAEKAEKHEEKKHHGGILGLFKRDKPDDELKRENLERKGELPSQGAESSTTTAADAGAGAGATSRLSEFEQHERSGEHAGMSEADKLRQAREHDRNRLHKDPPPGYIEKKMEEHGQGHGGSSGAGYETGPDGRVIEPHTGLPMDLSKSDGRGGTDESSAPGFHGH